MWNSLPNDMRKVTEFAEFRRQFAPGRTRAADMPSVAVREASQHVPWTTVIFYFLLDRMLFLIFSLSALFSLPLYFFFAAGSAFYLQTCLNQ